MKKYELVVTTKMVVTVEADSIGDARGIIESRMLRDDNVVQYDIVSTKEAGTDD